MKTIIIFLTVIILTANALNDTEILNEWKIFQKKYKKFYRRGVEEQTKYQVFKHNLENIEKHNKLYYHGKKIYKKNINKFSDWTKTEFRKYIRQGSTQLSRIRKRKFHIKKEKNYNLPLSIDWREKGAVTRVKDQGLCGACYAFSSVGAIEGQLKISTGKLVTLSEQHVIDCSWPQGNKGCVGGLAVTAMDYVKNFGIEDERSYPYIQKDGKCKYNSSKLVTKLKRFVSIPEGSEEDLQYALAFIGPVAVAIDSTFELQGYDEGILDDEFCTTYDLTHGVLVVGYGVENGVEYYIVKNSWGYDWGENGYFRLVRNKNNRCGIASLAVYPLM